MDKKSYTNDHFYMNLKQGGRAYSGSALKHRQSAKPTADNGTL
jgi:hypothetical protein